MKHILPGSMADRDRLIEERGRLGDEWIKLATAPADDPSDDFAIRNRIMEIDRLLADDDEANGEIP